MAAYAKWLRQGAEKFGVAIHAWVLMTNHVHLLATPAESDSISSTMQYLGRYYVRHFNFRYDRTGTLYEGRYKANLVQSSHYFLICCRYIELNPVRAGMVDDPADYVWSSYGAHAFGRKAEMWTPHSEYLALGPDSRERQNAYRALVSEALPQPMLEDIRQSTQTGLVLGNEDFRSEVEALTGQVQRHQKRGPKPSRTARY